MKINQCNTHIKKTHMIISIDTEKTFDKIQHFLMRNTFNKQ